MTLWDVDDQATASLIEDFYAILKTGKPVAEALQEAKQNLLRKNTGLGWSNPYYWSGIVYFGKDEAISPASTPYLAGWRHVPLFAWMILLLLILAFFASYRAFFPGGASSQKK
jgi:hypothetical protein